MKSQRNIGGFASIGVGVLAWGQLLLGGLLHFFQPQIDHGIWRASTAYIVGLGGCVGFVLGINSLQEKTSRQDLAFLGIFLNIAGILTIYCLGIRGLPLGFE